MNIFKLSAPETVRLLSGHILPKSESNFTDSHLDFKKISRGETPGEARTLAYKGRRTKGRGEEGIKGFQPLKGH